MNNGARCTRFAGKLIVGERYLTCQPPLEAALERALAQGQFKPSRIHGKDESDAVGLVRETLRGTLRQTLRERRSERTIDH
jgi:hypothetical protein